jgi:hypothetical protein
MYKHYFLAALALSLLSNTGHATAKQSSEVDSFCKSIIDTEIRRGAKAFTESMVQRMTKRVMKKHKVTTAEQAKRCIIMQLIEHKVPFED